MTTIKPLTKRQREVYEFLVGYIRDNKFAPTYLEIGAAIGASSLATVASHINRLVASGYIAKTTYHARGIALLMVGECCPVCGHVDREKGLAQCEDSR